MKIVLSPNPFRDRGLKTAQSAARILNNAGVETRDLSALFDGGD